MSNRFIEEKLEPGLNAMEYILDSLFSMLQGRYSYTSSGVPKDDKLLWEKLYSLKLALKEFRNEAFKYFE